MDTIRWAIASLAVALTFAPQTPGELNPEKWRVGGQEREALVWMPAPATTPEPPPLVIVFHGHGGTMGHAARSIAIHRSWPEAAVAYPQGLPTPGIRDPEGQKAGWQQEIGDGTGRDLAFFDAMLASLAPGTDPDRVFATGHSNGGRFCFVLWAARGEKIRALAPSGSPASIALVRRFEPKPYLHIAGESDPIVRFRGQELTIAAIRKLNGCGGGSPWESVGDIQGVHYPSPSGTPVFSLIHPGGHGFPHAAPPLIVSFFQAHSAPAHP